MVGVVELIFFALSINLNNKIDSTRSSSRIRKYQVFTYHSLLMSYRFNLKRENKFKDTNYKLQSDD